MKKCSSPSQPPSSARVQCACEWPCPLSGLLSPELYCFLPPSLWSVTGNRGAVGDSSFTFLCSVLWAVGIDSHCLLSLCLKWSYPELDYSFCCGSYDYSFISCLSNDFLLYIYILKNFCVFECLPACMCVRYMHACYLWRPEERVRSLELQLQIVMSHHVDAGNQTWISARAASDLKCCLVSSAPVNRSTATMIHWVLPVAVFTVRWQKYIWGTQQTAAAATAAT